MEGSILHLQIFGCPAYAHIPEQKQRKLDPRSEKLLLVGYMDELKAYKLFHPQTHKVTHARTMLFHKAALLKRTADVSSLTDFVHDIPGVDLPVSDFESPEEFFHLGGEIQEELVAVSRDIHQVNSGSESVSVENQGVSGSAQDSQRTQVAHLEDLSLDTSAVADDSADETKLSQPSSPVTAPRRSQRSHQDRSQWSIPPYSPPDFRVKGVSEITKIAADKLKHTSISEKYLD